MEISTGKLTAAIAPVLQRKKAFILHHLLDLQLMFIRIAPSVIEVVGETMFS